MRTKTERILWSELKVRLVRRYPTLTKSDLIWRHGSIDEMLDTISSKLGVTVQKLKEEIE
jgi:hypothetical protein